MEAEIDGLISQLTTFKERLAALKDLAGQKDRAAFELKTIEATLASTKAELANAQSGLSMQQQQNKLEFDRNFQEKSKELENILAQIVKAKEELATVTAESASAMQLHRQIEASIGSLRARLG